jgi:uncharacterized membrane protein YidH (DUF202 family)
VTAVRRPVETDRDPGLQPERTRLAWRRTTLSCAVTAVLAGRQVLHGGGPSAALGASLAALVFLVFLWLAHRRILQLGAQRPVLLPPSSALTVAACMVALAVFGAAVVW